MPGRVSRRGGFFFSSRRRHTRFKCDWSSDVCSSDLSQRQQNLPGLNPQSKFVCVECGFSAQADFVGAVNIKEARLALLACSQPLPAARAWCQEPTEATRVPSCA